MAWEPKGVVAHFTPDAGRRQLVDWLYLETVNDMQQRCTPPHGHSARYRYLGLAPLLRKVLLDGDKSLIHQARRVPGRPAPVFHASPLPIPQQSTTGFGMGVGLGPSVITSDVPPISLDKFLKLTAGYAGPHVLSVKEVIQHYAHVEGGVHLGRSKDPASDALQLAIADQPEGIADFVSGLAQIALVTVAGLLPLTAAVGEEHERRRLNPRPEELQNAGVTLGLI